MKEQANFRVDAEAKTLAYAIFERMGIKPTDAVNMFMHHVAMHGELPFQPRVPNAGTLAALSETELSATSLEGFRQSLGLPVKKPARKK